MTDPVFSVLVPVYEPDREHLRAAVRSVLAQSETSWELVAVLDGPHPPEVAADLASFGDDRIRVLERDTNGGISAASEDARRAARGEFLALLDQDDLLAPFALAANRAEIDRFGDVDVLYSDEDKIAVDGRRDEPFCKPMFSPERLRCHMYLGHLGVYRAALVDAVGGFREGFDGAQDHDLTPLRTTEVARRVVHIPRVLYHWRRSEGSTAENPEAKAWAFDAGVRAVQSHMDRIGMQAEAYRDDAAVVVRARPRLTTTPMVTIVIPTGGGTRVIRGERIQLITRTVESIGSMTSYPDFEIVVVADSRMDERAMHAVQDLLPGRVRCLRNERPFNFSEACNFGRDHARGEVLVFLNDDCEIVTEHWLERFVLFADLDDVGVVGAFLEYPDGRIQHAGLMTRAGGINHRHVGEDAAQTGEFNQFVVTSNVVAVTGACIAVRRDRFDMVGGFSERFPLAFNDVDLCFKLLALGFRTVFDGEIRVVHYESSSRDPRVTPDEIELLEERWHDLLWDDPYDNPMMRTYGFHQIQPPAGLIELRERFDDESGEAYRGRAWPRH